MQVFHGKVIACDANNTRANYLVEKEGRIAYIGDELPKQYEVCPPIEIETGAIVPAFIDAHCNYAAFSVRQNMFPYSNIEDSDQLINKLKEIVEYSNDDIVVAFCSTMIIEQLGCRSIRDRLDEICPERPMIVFEEDAKAAVVNSAAVEFIRSRCDNVRGFNEFDGEITFEAFNILMDVFEKGFSTKNVIEAMNNSIDSFAAKGISGIYSSTGFGFVRDYDFDMERSFAKSLNNGFVMSVGYQTDDAIKSQKRDISRIVFPDLDGYLSKLTASLVLPYADENNKGLMFYSDEDVLKFCKDANRAGYQIALKASGDAAFYQAAQAIAGALEDYPRFDHRHIILNCSMPTEKGLAICRKYNIMLGLSPMVLSHSNNMYSFLEDNLGEERAGKLIPARTCLDYELKCCMISSAPISMPDPIAWINSVCNHPNPKEAIGVYEALRMCTYYGAKACFAEKERGSLEIGKICDLAILSHDPYELPTNKLGDIKVQQLYLHGKSYESARVGAMTTMIRGILP